MTVLVTGVSRHLGARFIRELAAGGAVGRVIGLDVVQPHHCLGTAEFVRADIRNPLVGRIIAQTGVETVVHLGVSAEHTRSGGARLSEKERNVIGTMQLLAACQGRSSVRRIVLNSTASVYGSSPRDPAVFTEDSPIGGARSGYVRDAVEAEGYVRGVVRRRPDIATCVLRMAHVVGRGVESTMTDYFRSPVLPVPLGFDARLQLLHADDAIAALTAATIGSTTGVVNVAGEGVITLHQAAALLGRPTLPIVTTSGRLLRTVARRTHFTSLSDDEIDYLLWGRCLDLSRLRRDLGVEPAWTTRAAFEDFAAGVTSRVDVRKTAGWIDAVGSALHLDHPVGSVGSASRVDSVGRAGPAGPADPADPVDRSGPAGPAGGAGPAGPAGRGRTT